MNRMIECVPNFSEGRDKKVIEAIADSIRSVSGVRLLNIDPGEGANRTVMTFVGEPECVTEAAFRMTETAGRLIDMSLQHGTHPRIGATDVLPLVPISGVTLDETAMMAEALGRRIADELKIPCYLYEKAAKRELHRNLASCRKGEYEGLAERMASADENDHPDLGWRPWDKLMAHTGCTVVGARDLLIAVNFNLDTTDTNAATDIARAVRERGYQGRPGTLQGTKAIGWYIPEYGFAQVSMNICDRHKTPLHEAFREVSRQAEALGLHVTGTELIGMVPMQVLTDAGRAFKEKDAKATDVRHLIQLAIERLGLSQISPYLPEKRIIELAS